MSAKTERPDTWMFLTVLLAAVWLFCVVTMATMIGMGHEPSATIWGGYALVTILLLVSINISSPRR